jgi:TfoX/Sxy family transcriptional regulator of competence genes
MGNIDLLEDACASLPHTTRAMFGGHGLFAPHGGIFAAVVDDDRIILKFADDAARAELEGSAARRGRTRSA